MKTIARCVILAVALCASAFAGVVTDSANVFGPRLKEVENAVRSLPVWIETRVQPPSDGLKTYADAKAGEMGDKAFYVVITTQPREWRVSMNPVGLASSEAVRLAGERMVSRFKRGEFAPGAIQLAHDLNRLTQPPTPREAPGRVAAAYRAEQKREESNGWFWTWIIAGSVASILLCCWIVWALNRRSERLERERRERWSAPRAAPAQAAPAPNVDATEARRVFDSYTPEQRRTIIEERHHHHYSSGASTDPLMFYLLMNATMQPHYHHTPIYEAPRHHTPAPAPDPEPERRRESSSDSYSSPSYDSGGGSSYDSGGSSSDSSGGGGSW
jgi:uncharacterized membrane protein YgcG